MEDLPNIDPNFEPQSRLRSSTWPMKRPNIGGRKDNSQEEDAPMMLETTFEEPSFPEQVMPDDIMSFTAMSDIKQEDQDDLIYQRFTNFMDSGNELLDSACGFDQISDYGSMLLSSQPPSSLSNESQTLSFTKLETIPQGSAFPGCSYVSKLAGSNQDTIAGSSKLDFATGMEPVADTKLQIPSTSSNLNATPNVVASKPKTSSRKNAWGNLSYADLITQAIESTPDKRLTLAQIYDWIVKNIEHFKDKGDSNSSAGWKNSVRHNLSLHNKFKRVQNEGTGKSSWWMINYEAKPNKPSRRRAVSAEASNSKLKHARDAAVSKKNELKKQKSLSKKNPASWVRSPNPNEGMGDFDHVSLNQVYNTSDCSRPRTSSNGSSLSGRMSPQRPVLSQDLEADGPAPLSPLASSYPPSMNFDYLGLINPSGMQLQNMESQSKVLKGLENMDILNPTSPMTQASNSDGANIYLNIAPSGTQQISSTTKLAQNPVTIPLTNPNYTTLYQQGRSSSGSANKLHLVVGSSPPQNKHLSNVDVRLAAPRQGAYVATGLAPQQDYSLSDPANRQQNGDNLVQRTILFASNDASQHASAQPSFQNQYQYCQVQNQPPQQQQLQQQQPQEAYTQRQSEGFYSPVGQQLNISGQQAPSQQQSGPGNVQFADPKYPADLSCIDNKDIFDPRGVDFDQLLPPDVDFGSCFSQENFDLVNMESELDVGKMDAASHPPPYPYPSNQPHVTSNRPINVQQQVYTQGNGACNTPQMMTVLSSPPNGAALNCGVNSSVVMGNGDVHFAQTRELLTDQNSNWSR